MQDDQQRDLVFIGAGGHAVSVANVAFSAGRRIRGFIDEGRAGSHVFDRPVVAESEALGDLSSCSWFIAIGDNTVREKVRGQLAARHGDIAFATLVHASAVISSGVRLGAGTVVMPQAVVGPLSVLGDFCIVNTHASIDHECVLADYSSLAPGAVTGGNVSLGLRSAISLGAMVKHGVKIGNDCVIGASSYVNADIPANSVAYGTPARIVRARAKGERYLG